MPLTENLSTFFDVDKGFAITATIKKGGTINGIYDNAYIDVFDSESVSKALTCATADAAAIKNGDRLKIDDREYQVKNIRNDGTGITILKLVEPVEC